MRLPFGTQARLSLSCTHIELLQWLAQVLDDVFLHVLTIPLLGFSLLVFQAIDLFLAQDAVNVVEILHHDHICVHLQVHRGQTIDLKERNKSGMERRPCRLGQEGHEMQTLSGFGHHWGD